MGINNRWIKLLASLKIILFLFKLGAKINL